MEISFNQQKQKRKRSKLTMSGNDSDSDSDSSSNNELVSRINNNIYFYDDVTNKSVVKLIKLLKHATDYVEQMNIKTNGAGHIYLHICSRGGSVFTGLAAMDAIQSNPVPVTTVMEGSVCSAATFIALGGATVTIRPSAYVLIHQITSRFWGKYEEFHDEKQTLDKLMKRLRSLYNNKTSIPSRVLDKMFKHDIYIDADDAIKWKIVHKVFIPS